ncbi:MAG: NAD(P)-dependent oxidoreductase [Henriciella sp.]|uniref:NAD(P)-dependent oxidoreductase n=1 Tax=Henriciella sp. TaxID=1968823 RepID=UPI0032ECE2CE
MAWTSKDISVRVIDKHEAVIRDVLAARFPSIRFVDSAEAASGLKVLMSFRPPEDEPLNGYDWVHAVGAGVDHLCAAIGDPERAPVITRTTGRMGEQIGEFCLGYALAYLQRMATRRVLQENEDWNKEAAAPRYAFDAQVAVFGTGSIGAGISGAFRALGAEVTGYSRSGSPRQGFDHVLPVAKFGLAQSPDVLVLALPATAETEGLVDGEVLDQLNDALLINVGRGSTLDHDALQRALSKGQVSHAVLDVFEAEPLPAGDWRWSHPAVTVTPHVSGLTLPDDAANRFCELLEAYLDTGEPPVSVDIQRGY